MKFSYSWLKEWIDLAKSPEETSEILTMGGVEVEELSKAAPEFTGVVVAKVLEVKKHPDADKLHVTKVDAGTGEEIQIVCGAPNVAPGIKVPCALPKAVLPGNFKIKPTKMRGEASNGMLCSARELGLPEKVYGLLILPEDAPVGTDFRDYLDLDDAVIELKITPNRADCLGMIGVARELMALTGVKMKDPGEKAIPAQIDRVFKPEIQSPEDCGRFVTRVIEGVDRTVPTPRWMVDRLERAGIRSVEFLVDVGNYVMMELGQPLHVFDLDKLEGHLIARRAREGEELTCLNGKTVKLKDNTLVIADEKKPLSLAGLMGGESSAVSETTKNVCIESAWFNPDIIMGKSRQYEFGSDSSYRFERGVDYLIQKRACERATELITQIAGGKPGPVSEAVGKLPEAKHVKARYDRIRKILGVDVKDAEIERIVADLGIEHKKIDGGLEVVSPSFRYDIECEEDLVEEVGRIHGYSNIPFKNPMGELEMLAVPEKRKPLSRLQNEMCLMGYQEVVNYSFVNRDWEKDFTYNEDPVKLQNPLIQDSDFMRSSLIGSLVDNLSYNIKRKSQRVKIFETAQVFRKFRDGEEKPSDVSFRQALKMGGLCWGLARSESWTGSEDSRSVDFYDVKGELERIFATSGLKGEVSYKVEEHKALHPGRSAMIYLEGKKVGFLGELHPLWVHKYDLHKAPVVFEINLDDMLAKRLVKYDPISKFPEVRRDLAIVVPVEVTHDEFIATLKGRKFPEIVEGMELFDVYRGKGVDEDKKSMALKIIFNHKERTLQDEEVESYVQSVVKRAQEAGWSLRA